MNNNFDFFDTKDISLLNGDNLNVYVELSVSPKERIANGISEERNYTYKSLNPTINVGVGGMLTTEYTDLTLYNELLNETIGIKEIKISNDSWYHPRITIIFKDIRGYEMTRKRENNAKGFFDMMFSYPYPFYYLTIQGFLGKSITYGLITENLSMDFDAENGDFNINAVFVSSMFGPISDIPLNLIIMSPFFGQESIEYWNQKKDNGEFIIGEEKAKCPTFMELVKRIDTLPSFQTKTNSKSYMNEEKTRLSGIIESFPLKGWTNSSNKDFVFTISENKLNGLIFEKSSFLKSVKKYDSSYDKDYTTYFDYLNANPYEIDVFLDENGFSYENKGKNRYFLEDYEVVKRRKEYELIKKTRYYVYVFDFSVDLNLKELKDDLNLINQEIKKEEKAFQEVRRQEFISGMKFLPSVKNLYDILLCHIDMFMHFFNGNVDKINKQYYGIDNENKDYRKITHYGINIQQTDCKTEYLPPFPGIYIERNRNGRLYNEVVWPGDLTNGQDMVEVKMVNSIISSITGKTKKQNDNTDIYNLNSYVPLSSEDLLYYLKGNQTMIHLPITNTQELINEMVIKISCLLYSFLLERKDKKIDSFAELCADNFYNGFFKSMAESIKNDVRETLRESNIVISNEVRAMIDKGIFNETVGNSNITYAWNNLKMPINIQDFNQSNYEDFVDFSKRNTSDYDYMFFENNDIESEICKGNSNVGLIKDVWGIYNSSDKLDKDNPYPFEFYGKNDSKIGDAINFGIFRFGDYYPKYPSIVDGKFGNPLYGNKIYYLQESISTKEDSLKAKAYIFLMSIPLLKKDEIYKFDCENGTTLYVDLLREGAYRWRYNNMVESNGKEDGLAYKGKIFNAFSGLYESCSFAMPNAEQIHMGKNKLRLNTINFYEDKKNYPNAYFDKSNKIRNEKLISEFEKWAMTDFVEIDSFLRNRDNYNDNWSLKPFSTSKRKYYNGLKTLFSKYVISVDSQIKLKKSIEIRRKDLEYGLKKTLDLLYSKMKKEIDSSIQNSEEISSSSDLKLSLYLTLKNLYDKWITVNNSDFWKYNNNDGLRGHFRYLDIYKRDIGDKILIDLEKMKELLLKCIPSTSFDTVKLTAYNYFSEVALMCNGQLMITPYKEEDFPPFSIYDYEKEKKDNLSFVFLYSYRLSEHLGNVNGYKDDGITHNDNVLENISKPIPVYGITFGQPEQGIVKKMTFGMQNAMTTEYGLTSVKNILANETSSRQIAIRGQDMYQIFDASSYECVFEMLGNVQILPLMFFEVTNIPLWKGIYIVIGIDHDINDHNDMVTRVKSVRLSKYSLPIAGLESDILKIQDISGRSGFMVSQEYGSIDFSNGIDRTQEIWNYVFNVLNLGSKKYCARYTYQLAASFKGKDVIFGSGSYATPAGGNANQETYWTNLLNLGYSKVFDNVFDVSSYEMKDFLEKYSYKNGDVMVYFAVSDKYSEDSAVRYGHTQFYVNNEIGWCSSVKDNYNKGTVFVYTNRTMFNKWRVILFRG